MQVLRIVDFTKTPGARNRADGPFSGEQFREELLEPAFTLASERNEKLVVDLDGTQGYATSFLEEAFGGLARKYGSKKVEDLIEVRCTDEPDLVEEVMGYVRNPNG